MSYKVTNISGGQIVCDLAVQGETLRLNNRQTKTIKDIEITPHIKNMMTKGLILMEKISAENQTVAKKTNASKNSKEKEDKQNG